MTNETNDSILGNSQYFVILGSKSLYMIFEMNLQ